jgi:hypothetical protein
MTMPGFEYYFLCDECNETSPEYPAFMFHDLLSGAIHLPGWSRRYEAWFSINLTLPPDLRKTLPDAPKALSEFTSSISTSNLTVGYPSLQNDEHDELQVRITPQPNCPHCGATCQGIFGHAPTTTRTEFAPKTIQEFNNSRVQNLNISIRTRAICHELDIRTVGELEIAKELILQYRNANESTATEINQLLSLKPSV